MDAEDLDRADADAKKRRLDDPEMNERHWFFPKDLVEALAVGIMRADNYFRGYTLPPNFEAVLNRFHFRLVEAVKFDPMARLSLNECWPLLSKLSRLDPDYTALEGDDKDAIEVSTLYDAPKKRRTFVDLLAVTLNAIVHLRTQVRERA